MNFYISFKPSINKVNKNDVKFINFIDFFKKMANIYDFLLFFKNFIKKLLKLLVNKRLF